MNQLHNQRQINAVNGNVMAWLADKQIDDEYEQGLRELRRRCVKCHIQNPNDLFIDGICSVCRSEDPTPNCPDCKTNNAVEYDSDKPSESGEMYDVKVYKCYQCGCEFDEEEI